jgi:hypothetical protein
VVLSGKVEGKVGEGKSLRAGSSECYHLDVE